MRWGLVPYWAKDIKTGLTMFNWRSEEVISKPAFSGPWERGHRCRAKFTAPKGQKQPWLFKPKDDRVMAFSRFGVPGSQAWNGTGASIAVSTIRRASPNHRGAERNVAIRSASLIGAGVHVLACLKCTRLIFEGYCLSCRQPSGLQFVGSSRVTTIIFAFCVSGTAQIVDVPQKKLDAQAVVCISSCEPSCLRSSSSQKIIAKKETKMAENAIARIKELNQERAGLISSGKKEALDRAKVALDDLKALGFTYRLVEGTNAITPAVRNRKRVRQVMDTPCPVCKFKTNPLHDARKHRGQGKRKRAFTPAELKEFGLQKA
jgi:hypothetical protein